jgi:lipoate-protein ligase A
MSESWRLLELGMYDAYTNMAIDEAILMARIENKVPNTLRFYRWKPSAVSLGYTRRVEEDVYIEACHKNGVQIVRRCTGGGTVYHDADDEITYSVVVDEEFIGLSDISKSYEAIYRGIIEAIETLGLKADFGSGTQRRCPNLMVQERKISGSSQARRRGVLLQHGTVLVRVDLRRMFTLLKVPWSSNLEEVLKVAKRKITSIEQETVSNISISEAYRALVKGFRKRLGVEFKEDTLTGYEWRLAKKLRAEKYAAERWNFKRATTR